jgi:hypothetical protein
MVRSICKVEMEVRALENDFNEPPIAASYEVFDEDNYDQASLDAALYDKLLKEGIAKELRELTAVNVFEAIPREQAVGSKRISTRWVKVVKHDVNGHFVRARFVGREPSWIPGATTSLLPPVRQRPVAASILFRRRRATSVGTWMCPRPFSTHLAKSSSRLNCPPNGSPRIQKTEATLFGV